MTQAFVDPAFHRPIFIVSTPRSGSTLLFETLAHAQPLFTIGGESHGMIEGVPQLTIDAHGFDSNRLTGADATPPVAGLLRQRFYSALRDRAGAPPRATPVRLLEKTPKNALRIPFLTRVFPEALFVYLHRDAREVLNSMMEAWLSGRFRTYPNLPDWQLPMPWSLLLTPGWRQLAGKPLPQIVAAQYEACVRILLDDLSALPPEQVVCCRYDAFVADWGGEIQRLCAALGLDWDLPTTGTLPNSRYTLSAPAPDKWRARADEIEPLLPRLEPIITRAEQFVTSGQDRACVRD